MADEVTKKDLQSLQGYVNKRIGDLEAKITKLIDEQKVNTQSHSSYERSFNGIWSQLGELERAVAKLQKGS